jgi:hypothetical protein
MKKLLLYSMLLMGCMSAGVLTSCGSDGDSDGGGNSDSSTGKSNGVITLSDKTIGVTYGFFNKQSSQRWYLEFYNYDLLHGTKPSVINGLVIGLKTKDAFDQIPTGEFTNFSVDIIEGQLADSEDSGNEYEGEAGDRPNSKLTITRNSDGSYTISYDSMDLYGEDSKQPAMSNTSFTFTGTLEQMDFS